LYHVNGNQPELICALCMDDVDLAAALGFSKNIGRCNCIL